MSEETTTISKQTKMPLSMVYTLLVIVAVGASWGMRLEMKVTANTEMKEDVKQIKQDVADIKLQLAIHNNHNGEPK